MKLFIFFAFFSVAVFGQENFKVEAGKITWQKVYEADISEAEIKNSLQADPVLNPVAASFAGDSNPADLTCDQSQAIYMSNNMVFFTRIETKEGRYRVTVSNIRFIPSSTAEVFGVETTSDPVSWEDYQVRHRDGQLRKNGMAQNSRECLDKYFSELFDFKTEKEEW